MPDIPTVHSALGFILTGWLAFNAGIIAGAWCYDLVHDTGYTMSLRGARAAVRAMLNLGAVDVLPY